MGSRPRKTTTTRRREKREERRAKREERGEKREERRKKREKTPKEAAKGPQMSSWPSPLAVFRAHYNAPYVLWVCWIFQLLRAGRAASARGALVATPARPLVLSCCSEIAFSDRCAKLRSLFFGFLCQAQFCTRDATNKRGAWHP